MGNLKNEKFYNIHDSVYLSEMGKILSADFKENRTGVKTKSLFGAQMRFDLTKGFPLLTSKRVHFKSVAHELIWFLSGETNTKYLEENGVTIWREWQDENGDLGPVYGFQWRNFGGVDQIKELEKTLQTNPDDRRMIVSAWNPADVDRMALPPCHMFFQLYTQQIGLAERAALAFQSKRLAEKDIRGKSVKQALRDVDFPERYISLQMYQRSADWFLGVPFNIASYALLLEMLGKSQNMIPKHFVHTIGDAHIYENHIGQCYDQLSREMHSAPRIALPRKDSVLDYSYSDIQLLDYKHSGTIKAEVAV